MKIVFVICVVISIKDINYFSKCKYPTSLQKKKKKIFLNRNFIFEIITNK